MIQKTKLKKIFHEYNLQITTEAVNVIDEEVRRTLTRMAIRCQHGNVKRLTPELMWVALGNIKHEDFK